MGQLEVAGSNPFPIGKVQRDSIGDLRLQTPLDPAVFPEPVPDCIFPKRLVGDGETGLLREVERLAPGCRAELLKPPTKSVGEWQITYFSPRHCTSYRNGWRGDNQAVSVERQNGEHWLYFITDQTSPPGEPASMLIAQFRDFERHGDVREYTVARVGDQLAYGLKLDAETRPYFAGGRFFTLLANLADEAAVKGRGDTFFTVGISSALAALDAC